MSTPFIMPDQPKPPGRLEQFKFDLNDRVVINEVQRTGKIEALMIDFLGPQYRVVYWDNSERKTCWVQAEEISGR